MTPDGLDGFLSAGLMSGFGLLDEAPVEGFAEGLDEAPVEGFAEGLDEGLDEDPVEGLAD